MKLPRILSVLALLFTATALSAADTAKMPAKDAAKLVAEGKAVLVDCREPAEAKESGIAAPAVLLPKSDFDADQKEWKAFLAANAGKQVLVYCRGGGRAATVAAALTAKGVPAASIGGLRDWTEAGLPTRPADGAAKSAAPAPGKK